MWADVSAALLVGGRGRRLGLRDKARLPSRQPGRNLVAWLVTLLRGSVADLFLVGRADQAFPEVDCRLIVDLRPDLGPLAALETALTTARTDWLFLVGCDLPDLTQSHLDRLAAARRPEVDAVFFLGPRGREPVCALYHARLRSAASAALDRGERSLQRWPPARTCARVALSPTEQAAWLNLNDEATLRRYLLEVESPQPEANAAVARDGNRGSAGKGP